MTRSQKRQQKSLADRLFKRDRHAKSEVETILNDGGVPYENIGWDSYDVSLEIHGVPADYRLSGKTRNELSKAGFDIVYVNHVDKWETHYRFGPDADGEGWRVSYPDKRGPDEESIWVEEVVPTWPGKWFDTGYVIVKPPASTSSPS